MYVRTSSGAVALTAAISKLKKEWTKRKFVIDGIDMDVTFMFQEFQSLNEAFSNKYWPDRVEALAVSLHLLNGRASTNRGDAYLCLSGMIGLSSDIVREIAQTPIEQRTTKMIKHLGLVPKGIIFSPGRKLKQEGYRWACEAFWKSKPYHDDGVAKIEGDIGLYLEYQGFLLDNMKLSGAEGFIFENPSTDIQLKVSYDKSDGPISDILSKAGYDAASSRLAVICPEREINRTPLGLATYPAALVILLRKPTLEKLGQSPLYTRYICQITLSRPSKDDVEKALNEKTMGKAKRPNLMSSTYMQGSEGVHYIPQHWYIT